MIFSEIYGIYYKTVAKIISLAIEGKLDERQLLCCIREQAFEESALIIEPALKNEEWQLIHKDFTTAIKHKGNYPLSILQKRWLKSISLDPRMALFDLPAYGLEDVEPLYNIEDIVYFDRYTDGDDYEDERYRRHFRIILKALKEEEILRISFLTKKAKNFIDYFKPIKLEYSDKEDKFRLLCVSAKGSFTINLSSICTCEVADANHKYELKDIPRKTTKVELELIDERNSLERAMMRFAHLKKRVERVSENTYKIELIYDKDDMTDMLIQIMSFGPFIKVVSDGAIKKGIRERIEKQKNMFM